MSTRATVPATVMTGTLRMFTVIVQAVWTVLTSLFFLGCGDPCAEADLRVGGLCVHTNDFIVDWELVELSVSVTESNFYQLLQVEDQGGFDLPTLLSDYRISVQFVDEIPSHDDRIGQYQAHSRGILVEYPPYLPKGREYSIEYHRYHLMRTLSHELLHFLDRLYFGSSGGHTTSGLWLKWARANGGEYASVVEGKNNLDFWEWCGVDQ